MLLSLSGEGQVNRVSLREEERAVLRRLGEGELQLGDTVPVAGAQAHPRPQPPVRDHARHDAGAGRGNHNHHLVLITGW